jgi:hypothetical protein
MDFWNLSAGLSVDVRFRWLGAYSKRMHSIIAVMFVIGGHAVA